MIKSTMLALLGLLLLLPCISLADKELPMSAISRNIHLYHQFLQEKNMDVLNIDNLESDYSNRNVACIVIIMQALHLGGYPAKVKLIEAPNYPRELSMVQSGAVAIIHQDAWDRDFNADVYKSSAIISKGEFIKGLYTSESNEKMLQVKTLKELKSFSAVSNSHWSVDWQTLEQIGLKAIYDVSKREHMFIQVLKRGVDFTIQEFPNNSSLVWETPYGRLVPVRGVKIALNGSRHFMISKKYKDGKKIYEALEKGLDILRKSGTIERYLSESGFFRREVEEWNTLNMVP